MKVLKPILLSLILLMTSKIISVDSEIVCIRNSDLPNLIDQVIIDLNKYNSRGAVDIEAIKKYISSNAYRAIQTVLGGMRLLGGSGFEVGIILINRSESGDIVLNELENLKSIRTANLEFCYSDDSRDLIKEALASGPLFIKLREMTRNKDLASFQALIENEGDNIDWNLQAPWLFDRNSPIIPLYFVHWPNEACELFNECLTNPKIFMKFNDSVLAAIFIRCFRAINMQVAESKSWEKYFVKLMNNRSDFDINGLMEEKKDEFPLAYAFYQMVKN